MNKQVWRVHVGVHKTGTTHLQHVMHAVATEVHKHGLRILPMETTRPMARSAALNLSQWQRQRSRVRIRLAHLPQLRSLTRSFDSVAFSDEDFLGWTQDMLGQHMYPCLSGLDLIAPLQRVTDLQVFVSIRDFPSILSFAFFEYLKVTSAAKGKLMEGASAVLSGRSSWSELLERIQTQLPNATLKFWRQEAYSLENASIVRSFLGVSDLEVPEVPRPLATASPSEAALLQVQHISDNLLFLERHSAVEKIYKAYPATSGKKPQLFSPAEVDDLKGMYEADLVKLRSKYEEVQ